MTKQSKDRAKAGQARAEQARRRPPHTAPSPSTTTTATHFHSPIGIVLGRLPDPNWAGNAIIDFEAYTPSWQLLESNYKTFSRNLVRQAHPHWGSAQVDAAASSAFEEKCNELFVGALQTARAARPKAYFGFYDIPRSYCPDCNLSWFARVVDASSAVFPSVYLQLPTAKDGLPPSLLSTIRNETFANFNRTVESAVSLAKGKPVYPFASMFNLVRPMTVLALQACLEAVQN